MNMVLLICTPSPPVLIHSAFASSHHASAGLTYDPQNAALQSGLKEAKQAQSKPQRGAPGNMFGPEFMAKLHMNPQTRPLLSQPEFMAMLQDMGSNPANMSKYLADPRLQQALSVGLGINMMSGDKFKQEQGMNGAGASAAADQDDDTDDDMPVCLLAHPCCCPLMAYTSLLASSLPVYVTPKSEVYVGFALAIRSPQLVLLSIVSAGDCIEYIYFAWSTQIAQNYTQISSWHNACCRGCSALDQHMLMSCLP